MKFLDYKSEWFALAIALFSFNISLISQSADAQDATNFCDSPYEWSCRSYSDRPNIEERVRQGDGSAVVINGNRSIPEVPGMRSSEIEMLFGQIKGDLKNVIDSLDNAHVTRSQRQELQTLLGIEYNQNLCDQTLAQAQMSVDSDLLASLALEDPDTRQSSSYDSVASRNQSFYSVPQGVVSICKASVTAGSQDRIVNLLIKEISSRLDMCSAVMQAKHEQTNRRSFLQAYPLQRVFQCLEGDSRSGVSRPGWMEGMLTRFQVAPFPEGTSRTRITYCLGTQRNRALAATIRGELIQRYLQRRNESEQQKRERFQRMIQSECHRGSLTADLYNQNIFSNRALRESVGCQGEQSNGVNCSIRNYFVGAAPEATSKSFSEGSNGGQGN